MMKEDDGIARYQWRLYRNDFGYWHGFTEDASWKVNQQLSAMEGIEILKSEYMEENWIEVNYEESTLMIAGNVDIIKTKEDIIKLIESKFPELIIRFI